MHYNIISEHAGIKVPSKLYVQNSNLYIFHLFSVESFKEVADCLCVGQRSESGDEERVILFLKMAHGSTFDGDLIKRVRTDIRMQLSARHVPAVILQIDDIPVSINNNHYLFTMRCINNTNKKFSTCTLTCMYLLIFLYIQCHL